MLRCVVGFVCVAVSSMSFAVAVCAKEVEPLKIGARAPELNLPGVDDKTYRLADFDDAELLVVLFTCNHCPTAQAYEQRIMQLYEEFHPRGVAFVVVSPNDPLAVRLDELGYTDVGDSLSDMKLHAKRQGFPFPYLYDGDMQTVSTAYGALATPHAFVFDRQRTLRYNGRIDDNEIKPPKSHDLRDALESLLAGRPVEVPVTRVFGCSTKWADKRDSARQALERWDAEPVELQTVGVDQLTKLADNATENYRLINFWSITCVPCITELPELVTVNRMYRGRHFELYTISMDSPDQQEEVMSVLSKAKMSCTNLIFDSDDRDAIAEVIDPSWRGPVPYTVLIAPGGAIVERWSDELDPAQIKATIVGYLGRTYASKK